MIIYGKNINLRTVKIKDAEFIRNMRRDKFKTKYLSRIISSIEAQRLWIEDYKAREESEKEFYFVIESKGSDKLGLVRMYDFNGKSFSWGSWLVKENAPKTTAIESVLQIYEFGFNKLGFEKSHFDVRKGNDRVVAFHKRFGANIVDQNQADYFFNFERKDYIKIREKYKRYI
jgi:RimJ/RimL family protein N-acetyltransferase